MPTPKMSYRWCYVPGCINTTRNAPKKLFFCVPLEEKKKKKWFRAARREYIPTKTQLFCCEDHFSLKDDMDNYIRYSLTGSAKKLKEDVLPHIFNCQNKREVSKKQVAEILEERQDPVTDPDGSTNSEEINTDDIPNDTEKACQSRWKNIRDYYQKKKREAKRGIKTFSRASSDGVNFDKFKYLRFLDNTSVVEKKSISNTNESSQLSNTEFEEVDADDVCPASNDAAGRTKDDDIMFDNSRQTNTDEEFQPIYAYTLQDSSSIEHLASRETAYNSDKSPGTSSRRKKPRLFQERAAVLEEIRRGRTERRKLMKNIIKQVNTPKEPETAISMFFRSIAATVEQFSPPLQTKAKLQVMKVISELEFENQRIQISPSIATGPSSTAMSVMDILQN